MPDDLTRKLVGTIQKMQQQINRLMSGRWLENASVRSGRLRFIGGLLRLDSGALLELFGQWRFTGPGAISGDVFSEGKWTQVGDYDFTGDGDLAGNVDLSGIFNLIGKLTAGGVRIEDGKIYVGTGASEILLDGATGRMSSGNVRIEGGKIYVGPGDDVVIDGATGRVTVAASGGVVIKGADGDTVLKDSKITFPNGTTVRADVDGGVISQGGVSVGIIGGVARMRNGTETLSVFSGGFAMTGLPTASVSSYPGGFVGAVVSDNLGNLSRLV